MGREFSAEEVAYGAPSTAMLLHGFWVRRFGADSGIIGRSITIDDAPTVVVGVLPASFDFTAIFAPGGRADYVSPFPLSPETNRQGNTLGLIGRLSPGVDIDASQEEVEVLAARMHSDELNDFDPHVRPLHEQVSGTYASAMILLSAAVGLVLLIVCANISNLMLARGAVRAREFAIRAAIGAGRGRLVRMMLTESIVLSLAGAGLGVGLAIGGTRLLAGMDGTIPLLSQARVDGVALGFALAAALVTGIVFGLAPALRISGSDLNDVFQDQGRGASQGRRNRSLRDVLVISEIALACLLLVGSGLLTRSFAEVLDVDLGFDPQNTVAIRIDPSARFETADARIAYYDDALRRVTETRGVEVAGLSDILPMGFNRRWCINGIPCSDLAPFVRLVSEGYLGAMGLNLLEGRDFQKGDDDTGSPVIIVNDVLAEILWPGEAAVGRSLDISRVEREVVGVVQGTRHLSAEQPPGPEYIIPLRQLFDANAVHVIARGSLEAPALAAAVGESLRPINATLPVNEYVTVSSIVGRSISPRRFIVLLMVGFAGFAVILASLGIYGVVSYSVAQRKREIGIRVALGASAQSIRGRILGETLRVAGLGVAIGLAASWALGRAIQSMLFGVTAADPVTYGLAPVVLVMVAAFAAYLPATRAARLDPLEALAME